MKRFVELFEALDRTPRTTEKVRALEDYLRATPAEDAAWALWFLAGGRAKRLVKVGLLRAWAGELAGLPAWLVDECYEVVGDLAETLALLLPSPAEAVASLPLSQLIRDRLLPLAGASEADQRNSLTRTWAELGATERFLWNKLITGGFRVGVSRTLLVRALAGLARVSTAVMAHRLMGQWQPTADDFRRLVSGEGERDDPARPFPFYLASPLEGAAPALGDLRDWQCEWKWDGIRVQLIRRQGACVLWSRGEEIITEGFPEVAQAALGLPDGTVLDGELLAWRGEVPLPFAQLQRRINRRNPGLALRREVPVVLLAFDLLEQGGTDVRALSLVQRRSLLEQLMKGLPAGPALGTGQGGQGTRGEVAAAAPGSWVQPELFSPGAGDAAVHATVSPASLALPIRIAPLLEVNSWEELHLVRAGARAAGTEGVMLKRRDSGYGVGRQRGAWWKWKVDPMTCDAVLVAAQPGHGRRAALFTDYTFAVWRGDELVPVAKAYSGLTDAEIEEVDAFVRANTTGRFGPVRSVKAERVFELAFEGIARSPRHRGGLALRFPRILRSRTDKRPRDADSVDTLLRLAGDLSGCG